MPVAVTNPELIKLARSQLSKLAAAEKRAFIAGGDPSMGADPSAPPQDPAMAAGGGAPPGAPPMDPAMAAGGGAPPPMDPAAAGGGGPDIMSMINQAVQTAVQQQGATAGGASGSDGMLKPKIDVNVEIMQMKELLAKIADALGVQISASSMVATPEKLTQMAQGGAAGGGGAPPPSAIQPISPMAGASPDAAMGKAAQYIEQGTAIVTGAQRAERTGNTAAAILRLRRQS